MIDYTVDFRKYKFKLESLQDKIRHQQYRVNSLIEPCGEESCGDQLSRLNDYIKSKRQWFLENAEITFSADSTSCEVSFAGIWSIEVTDQDTLGLLDIACSSGQGVDDFELEWMAPSDDDILGELPLSREPGNQLEVLELPSKPHCFALFAHHYNTSALSLVSNALDDIDPFRMPAEYHDLILNNLSPEFFLDKIFNASDLAWNACKMLNEGLHYSRQFVIEKSLRPLSPSRQATYDSKVEIARLGGKAKASKYQAIKEFVFSYYHQHSEVSVPKSAANMVEDVKKFCESIGQASTLAPSNIKNTITKWLYQHRSQCSTCQRKVSSC